jgi:hypothetical protein
MSSNGTSRIRIDVAGEIVEMTSRERDMLLVGLAWAPGVQAVRRKFAAVGTARPVELDYRDRLELWNALGGLGTDFLEPDGIARLHCALGAARPDASVTA